MISPMRCPSQQNANTAHNCKQRRYYRPAPPPAVPIRTVSPSPLLVIPRPARSFVARASGPLFSFPYPFAVSAFHVAAGFSPASVFLFCSPLLFPRLFFVPSAYSEPRREAAAGAERVTAFPLAFFLFFKNCIQVAYTFWARSALRKVYLHYRFAAPFFGLCSPNTLPTANRMSSPLTLHRHSAKLSDAS
jgi:hypothetical protein